MADYNYPLLSDAERLSVKETLKAEHAYFYHATSSDKLPSIESTGLDPSFERHIDTDYGLRRFEPNNALRFCTAAFIEVGISAANRRCTDWSDSHGIYTKDPQKRPILFRVSSKAFLNLDFGLDHSYGDILIDLDRTAIPENGLSAARFIGLVRKFGVLSCYERVVPGLLDVSTDAALSVNGGFRPLGRSERR